MERIYLQCDQPENGLLIPCARHEIMIQVSESTMRDTWPRLVRKATMYVFTTCGLHGNVLRISAN